MTPAAVEPLVKFVGAAGWTLAYLLIVRRGLLDRASGMPWLALAVNLAIEFVYGFPLAADAPRGFPTVYRVWLLVDVVILVVALRFHAGSREAAWPLRGRWSLIAATLCATAVVWAIGIGVPDRDGRYTAFSSVAVMSGLYVRLAGRTPSGQSLFIGSCRLVGTAAFLAMLVMDRDLSLAIGLCAAASLALDTLYLRRLHATLVTHHIPPWRF